jgi:glycosyltransferase involved in cell wall biosynthesis
VTDRVFFLARSLGRGGAERQLVALAIGLARRGHDVAVVTFYDGGVFLAELVRAGVRVIELGKKGRWDVLPFLHRLVRVLRDERPTVLHGYLPVANILTAICKPLLPATKIVWGIRASQLDMSHYDLLARAVQICERRLSKFSDCIIANSTSGKMDAVAKGFGVQAIAVIPNGIDADYFRFDVAARRRVRAEWKVGDGETLIGVAARLDPFKNHPMFLQAAARIARQCAGVRFACIGDGDSSYAESLQRQASAMGLADSVVWAGARDDMPAVYSALDLSVSASSSEGFSNSIAEAMACGIPTIVTDVGDSAEIVGDTCAVVPAGDPDRLAAELLHLISLSPEERRALGDACRSRVVLEYRVERLIDRTERALGLA